MVTFRVIAFGLLGENLYGVFDSCGKGEYGENGYKSN